MLHSRVAPGILITQWFGWEREGHRVFAALAINIREHAVSTEVAVRRNDVQTIPEVPRTGCSEKAFPNLELFGDLTGLLSYGLAAIDTNKSHVIRIATGE